MVSLKEKRMFMLDMDGTIYNENVLIEGASEFFTTLNAQGKSYTFMTNNSSKGKYDYVQKLNKLGIPCNEAQIVSSVNATIDYLHAQQKKARIYLVGTNSC